MLLSPSWTPVLPGAQPLTVLLGHRESSASWNIERAPLFFWNSGKNRIGRKRPLAFLQCVQVTVKTSSVAASPEGQLPPLCPPCCTVSYALNPNSPPLTFLILAGVKTQGTHPSGQCLFWPHPQRPGKTTGLSVPSTTTDGYFNCKERENNRYLP